MFNIKPILFFAILASLSWSKEKKEVEVPINVGVGPAFFWIPGVVERELHPGAKFDLYAVLTPKVLQENKNRIPKQYQKYVNTEEEMHITLFWMLLLPKYLIISPEVIGPGTENSIYGGLWSFFTLSSSNQEFYHSFSILGSIRCRRFEESKNGLRAASGDFLKTYPPCKIACSNSCNPCRTF